MVDLFLIKCALLMVKRGPLIIYDSQLSFQKMKRTFEEAEFSSDEDW